MKLLTAIENGTSGDSPDTSPAYRCSYAPDGAVAAPGEPKNLIDTLKCAFTPQQSEFWKVNLRTVRSFTISWLISRLPENPVGVIVCKQSGEEVSLV
jgi:hypothetical protein